MLITNRTPFVANWYMGYNKEKREQLAIIIKATYDLPLQNKSVAISAKQIELTQTDISTKEPGFSSVQYESDLVCYKPYCDVLFNGCAYSPLGEPVKHVDVSLQVANLKKSFRVVGNRHWSDYKLLHSATSPIAFDKMPISYDNAFGGIDWHDKEHPRYYYMNPAGVGFSYHRVHLEGLPLPNTEELGHSINQSNGKYRPMALGAIGRAWQPRVNHAGTYDENWQKNIMPFWPEDFDYRYFQAAPPDQQMPYLTGGEQVILTNLSSQPNLSFSLPEQHLSVIFIQHNHPDVVIRADVDTLLIEPELGVFTQVSRAVLPLRKNCFDIKEVIILNKREAEFYHKQRTQNKRYYKSLFDFISSKG